MGDAPAHQNWLHATQNKISNRVKNSNSLSSLPVGGWKQTILCSLTIQWEKSRRGLLFFLSPFLLCLSLLDGIQTHSSNVSSPAQNNGAHCMAAHWALKSNYVLYLLQFVSQSVCFREKALLPGHHLHLLVSLFFYLWCLLPLWSCSHMFTCI